MVIQRTDYLNKLIGQKDKGGKQNEDRYTCSYRRRGCGFSYE